MKKAKFNWQKLELQSNLPEGFAKEAKKLKIEPLVAELIFARGFDDKAKFDKFTKGTLEDLFDPFLLSDMEKACKRINQAIERDEKILVYGDYDCDGITATTIMV
jgi:single-stranded-DNA-specific exonuclease